MPCLFKCALIKVPWALLLNRAKVSAQIINLSCFPVHLLSAFLHLRWLTRIYLVETNSTLEVQVPSIVLNVISFLPPILWNMTIPHSYFQSMLWVSQSYTHFLSRWIILGDAQHSQRLSVTTLWLSFLFPVLPPNLHPQPLLHQLGRVRLPQDVTCLKQHYLAVRDAPAPWIGQKRAKEVFNGQGISCWWGRC